MILKPGYLSLPQLRQIAREQVTLQLDPASHAAIDACAQAVADITARGEPAYGINTGFGRLASTHIPRDQLELLQRNLVLSHAVGVGEPMSRPVVRLLIALKLSSLGRGHSGIRREVMEALIALFNADVLPVIPVKGSVGASGDLAPLAHMSATLLGVGEVFAKGERMPATEGLALVGLKPLTLQAKEGLALLNGTQASTALALYNMFAIEDLYRTALVAGALSVDAAMGSVKPFDARIHELRGHRGQIDAAAAYRSLLQGSAINVSHADCDKVQDPYSLRCQPQVMGACLDQMRNAAETLLMEANAVSDNPLIFPDTGEVLSGGNFHAEPVAFAADNLALAVAEIGALAERRIALLIDATLSGLPPFLVKDGGVNSGFMIAHVTAAALASENRRSRIRLRSIRCLRPRTRKTTCRWRRSPRASSAISPTTPRTSCRSNCSLPPRVSICARRTRPARACRRSWTSCARTSRTTSSITTSRRTSRRSRSSCRPARSRS